MRKIRILIDARKASDSGIGRYIRNVVPGVVKKLLENNFECKLLVSSSDQLEWLDSNFNVLRSECKPLHPCEQFLLAKLADSYDCFWATSLAHPLYCSANLIATVHDTAQIALPVDQVGYTAKLFGNILLKSIQKKSNLIIFNSKFTKSEFFKYFGMPKINHVVTHLGVDNELLSDGSIEDVEASKIAGKYFIFVGNVKRHKNLIGLINSFVCSKTKIESKLLIIGSVNSANNNYKEAASIINSDDRLVFLGAIPDAALKKYVRGATALVFPSFYEGFGLPALEAMSMGTPVLASRIPSLIEVCGDAATYFDPYSQDEISSALVAAEKWSCEETRIIRKKSLNRAKLFSWAKSVDDTVTAILKVPNRRKGKIG